MWPSYWPYSFRMVFGYNLFFFFKNLILPAERRGFLKKNTTKTMKKGGQVIDLWWPSYWPYSIFRYIYIPRERERKRGNQRKILRDTEEKRNKKHQGGSKTRPRKTTLSEHARRNSRKKQPWVPETKGQRHHQEANTDTAMTPDKKQQT